MSKNYKQKQKLINDATWMFLQKSVVKVEMYYETTSFDHRRIILLPKSLKTNELLIFLELEAFIFIQVIFVISTRLIN